MKRAFEQRRRALWRSLAVAALAAIEAVIAMDMSLAAAGRTRIVTFATTPFPYDGVVPDSGKPFLDTIDGTRRGHNSPRGGIYWEDQAYSDKHVLLAIPPHFDSHRPAFLIVYLHGNKVMLARDVVGRQHVPQQLAESHLNAVLVAPQLAVDALDSSAGRFWEPRVFAQFLDEAADQLAKFYGKPGSHKTFATMPVVIVAYSGGYMPASAALSVGGVDERIAGVILLDALYGETDKFADWIEARHAQSFFFSAYSRSSADENTALQQAISAKNVSFANGVPQTFYRGSVAFLAVGDAPHEDFVTQAWTADPLAALLRKLKPGT